MKLISWNVAGWSGRTTQQAECITGWQPDLLAIQEVSRKSLSQFTPLLAAQGLTHSGHSLSESETRKKGVAVFSRWPLQTYQAFEVPFSRSTYSAFVAHSTLRFAIHNVHIPNGSTHKWKKIETFEGVYRGLEKDLETKHILCGDFNSPQHERDDGTVVVWGERITDDGSIKIRGDRRWRDGESLFFTGLPALGMPDTYRRCNGWEVQEFSWFSNRTKGEAPSRRFDHIFATESLQPSTCCYLHEGREQGLSDHSAIAAVFMLNDAASIS